MKIATLIARILLGLIFVFFGSNILYPFLPQPALPPGPALSFLTAFGQSHWAQVVGVCQLFCGLLLLVNRYVPLALALLGPIIFNILCFHLLMMPATIAPGIFVTILWVFLVYRYRQYFSGLFVQRADAAATSSPRNASS